MELWLDAHISPLIAKWIHEEFSIVCFSVKELGLRDADDLVIFNRAKGKGDTVILTKDGDFCELLNRLQAPPKIIWLTFGNCSNDKMKEFLRRDLPDSISVLKGNDLVEITG